MEVGKQTRRATAHAQLEPLVTMETPKVVHSIIRRCFMKISSLRTAAPADVWPCHAQQTQRQPPKRPIAMVIAGAQPRRIAGKGATGVASPRDRAMTLSSSPVHALIASALPSARRPQMPAIFWWMQTATAIADKALCAELSPDLKWAALPLEGRSH
mmetsp:Transcript_46621/g.92748  ORF Transcript_46621/g.92748 Transcript_46621/m.92748 type:complete len:157 (-) Transcript_46621:1070-1540(-)